MRNCEDARAPLAAAPGNYVEVEDPWSPAPAGSASKAAFDRFQAHEQFGWLKAAFDQRNGIGEVATGAAMRGVKHDRRSVEQAEEPVEVGDRRFDHAGGATVVEVAAVGTERDCVEVVWLCHWIPLVLSVVDAHSRPA